VRNIKVFFSQFKTTQSQRNAGQWQSDGGPCAPRAVRAVTVW